MCHRSRCPGKNMPPKVESLKTNSPIYNATFSLYPSSVPGEGQRRYGFTWHAIWYNRTASAEGISRSSWYKRRHVAELPLPTQRPTPRCSPQFCWLQRKMKRPLRSEREESKRKTWHQKKAEPRLQGEKGLTNLKLTRQNYCLLSQLFTDWPRLFLGFYTHEKPSQRQRGKRVGN